jgi:NADPH-dependent curcumin reductase CurA
MAELVNRRWILKHHPEGLVGQEHFELKTEPVPELSAGQALVRNVWLSFEPTQRTWLNPTDTYMHGVRIGETMRGAGVGVVVESKSDQLAVGDWVAGLSGWQDYAVAEGEGVFAFNKVPDGVPPRAMLGIFGSSGLTAYFGITEVAKVAEGDVVYVSGAAGAVGSMAGQVAALRGARVIGSAGGPEKCEWVRSLEAYEDCIDYKNEDIGARLGAFAPDGLSVYFDNVGGPSLEAALDNLALHARVVLCGAVSTGYDLSQLPPGPRNYMEIGLRRARMEGFVFLDYVQQFPRAFGELAGWMAGGALTLREDIAEGLENAPDCLRGLFEGRNTGKQLLEITDPSQVI